MAQKIRDVMTTDPVCLPATTTLRDAAETMRDEDIGDVLVEDNGKLCGVVTDRDIVVRAIAEGRDTTTTKLGDVCTRDVITIEPDTKVSDAVRLMSDKAVRRLPVIEGGRPVGMVSIGDLAMERDPDSALADISAAPPNN